MTPRAVSRGRGTLLLALILSVALGLQGVPTTGRRNNHNSGGSPAIEEPAQLKKWAGRAEVPLLPPSEELGSGVQRVLGTDLHQRDDYEDGQSSEDDQVSGFGIDGISGDNSIDYTDFHYPFSVSKPELQEDEKQGNQE